ncbi:MAG: phosphoribosylaminoimidazolesuccinocarboxamide synthase [Elusimicrobiales bacterium]
MIHQGKVRDLYEAGEQYLLIVSSDRLSAFDCVLPTAIPGKGEILNKLSLFWFERTAHIIKNHVVSADLEEIKKYLPGLEPDEKYLKGRAMLVRRTKRVDFECIVRGYLAGSGWKEYLKTGGICGIKLPAGLKEAQKLPEPVFTPTSKADRGHDENVSFEEMSAALGAGLAQEIRAKSLALYGFAAEYSARRGILLADTKFEFGTLNGELLLIDEALTPDSSRFWDAAAYEPGRSPDSYDKQFVRNWLERSGWDKVPPAPPLPAAVVEATVSKYLEALHKLTGL